MKRQDDYRAILQTRVTPQEKHEFEQLADRLYDGNLSLMVRIALRQFRDRVADDDDVKGKAA